MDRDRFILSKGHAGAGVYAALAESGFFPRVKLASITRTDPISAAMCRTRASPASRSRPGRSATVCAVGAGMAYAAKLRQARHACSS